MLEPGRELDRRIAALLGDQDEDGRWVSVDGSTWATVDRGPRHYSTDIADAWRVVPLLRKHWPSFALYPDSLNGREYWVVADSYDPEWCDDAVTGETAEHVLCIAVLAATGADK